MGNNASSPAAPLSSSGHGQRGGFLGAFLSGRRLDFTLVNMRTLHTQLTRFRALPDAEIVELLRVLSEFLIYSDQHRVSVELEDQKEAAADDAGAFFDYFGETNMLALLVELGATQPSVHVQVQLLQTMSILVQNIATRTSLYYILSNNHVNRLLECPFAVDRDDDVRDWYVTLLKALSLRLNEETVQFFLDTQFGDFSFPLYARALKFGRCNETMVKVAVKTLTLNVLKVPDARVRRFVLQYDDLNYFRDIVEIANDLTLNLQGLLNNWPTSEDTAERTAGTEKLEEAVDAYIDHCFYLQDLLDVNVPELCYKIGDLLFSRHIKSLLATSILPDCGPPPQRVSTQLALYLLTRLLGILEHTPLVNAIAFMLLSPDATEDCEYSVVALGAGSRRRHSSFHRSESVGSNDNEEDTATAKPASPLPSLRWDKEAPPMHVFRPHSATACDSSLCYVQTRFARGEWPVEEVKALVPQDTNCYRQSLVSLLCSSDERLSSTVLLLLLAIVNNKAVDHSLLRELDLLPFRFRRRNHVGCLDQTSGSGQSNTAQLEEVLDEAKRDNVALPGTASSSCASSSESQELEEKCEKDDDMELGTEFATDGTSNEKKPFTWSSRQEEVGELDGSMDAYPEWLVGSVLEILARNQSSRLLSVQLCARLLMDIMVDPRSPSPHYLNRHHAAALKNIHSSSAHLVMESMRGAMAEVDLFLYVLEKEVATFQRKDFPMELQLDSSSPFECLVPLESDEPTNSPSWVSVRDTLALRRPSDEMEVCRKSMRVFLSVRKLRQFLDSSYVDDELEQLIVYRHPRTSVLANAAGGRGSCTAPLDGMVSLKCMYREQRFLLMPTKLMMVMNPEAFVLVERIPDQNDDSSPQAGEGEGIVKVFAPIHRTYCTMDSRDDRVLQVSVRSVAPVPGCRTARQDKQSASTTGKLKDWNVLLMFHTAEDCAQAQAHINISGTEVRAFKLHQIEESLTVHLQVTQSSSGERRESFFMNAEEGLSEDKSSEESESEEEEQEEMEERDEANS